MRCTTAQCCTNKPRYWFPATVAVIQIGDGLFRCENLTEDNNCAIYESRPEGCRNYGEKFPCTLEGCTFAPEETPNVCAPGNDSTARREAHRE